MTEAELQKTEQKTNVGIMHCETEQQWFSAQIFARDALSRTWSEDKVLGDGKMVFKPFEGPCDIVVMDGIDTISAGRAGDNVRQIEGHLKPVFLMMADDLMKQIEADENE